LSEPFGGALYLTFAPQRPRTRCARPAEALSRRVPPPTRNRWHRC